MQDNDIQKSHRATAAEIAVGAIEVAMGDMLVVQETLKQDLEAQKVAAGFDLSAWLASITEAGVETDQVVTITEYDNLDEQLDVFRDHIKSIRFIEDKSHADLLRLERVYKAVRKAAEERRPMRASEIRYLIG